MEGCLVRAIQPFEDNTFGDDVVFSGMQGVANGSISGCRIEDNARAGLAVLGASMSLGHSTVTCNTIDLNGESDGAVPFALTDEGNNRCGCDPFAACKILSAGLAPPGSFGQF